jgi:hypothetical protein
LVILKTGVSLKTVVDLWSTTKLTFLTQQDHKPANQKLKESNTFWLHFKNPERKGSKTSKKTETFEIVWYHFPNPLSKKIWTFEEKKSKRSREMDQTWKMNLASSSMRAYLNTHTHTHTLDLHSAWTRFQCPSVTVGVKKQSWEGGRVLAINTRRIFRSLYISWTNIHTRTPVVT